MRLLEAKELRRKHWSAFSLGPVKHLGLSRAHGEVSSFGSLRLAFWKDGRAYEGGCSEDEIGEEQQQQLASSANVAAGGKHHSGMVLDDRTSSSFESTVASADVSHETTTPQPFLPAMPKSIPKQHNVEVGNSPLTPLFDQGSLRNSTPVRSPFFPSFAQQKMLKKEQQQTQQHTPKKEQLDWDSRTQSTSVDQDIAFPLSTSTNTTKSSYSTTTFGPPTCHHYAKEQFRTSVVHNDSNPIWGDAHNFLDDNSHPEDSSSRSTFRIPLQKDDFFPSLHTDGGRVALEVRFEEEMTPTESLLVGGALSSAVNVATAASSIVGVGKQTQHGAEVGMELLGLGKDRLIGKGYVDVMPLLLGLWEEDWEKESSDNNKPENLDGKVADEDIDLDEFGRFNPNAHMRRRRVERMGLLDVWVPLYHPSSTASPGKEREVAGRAHLLISYVPNGMTPKANDVVAFESFSRRPFADGTSSVNIGSVITPIVPPLYPLLVIDTRGSYLLLEYVTSRTVTSVDRSGNVKSSRWERTHRVRVHRNATFVIERRTFFDAVGDVARLPGDIALSTPIGQEIAEASAPIVAGAAELVGPALMWGKLMMAAGGTTLRASLAGARAATEAVVVASQERALQSRESDVDTGVYNSYRG